MRFSWDQLAKEVIPNVLEGVGRVQTSVEAQTDTQYIDLYVTPEPDVDWRKAFERLGWVARMAESPGVIEPYSRTVGLKEVRQCLRKQLTLFHTPGKAEEDEHYEVPRLWLLSVGDARTATDAFALGPLEGWPPGFRFGPWGLELWVIVISDLPKERATLPLRLLSRRETLRQAVEEARLLPEGDPMRRPMIEVLAQRRFARLHFSNDEDRSEAEMLQQEFKKFKERIHEEGRAEGRADVLRRQLSQKFGPLPEEVSARLDAATHEQLSIWIDRILVADSLAVVFAD